MLALARQKLHAPFQQLIEYTSEQCKSVSSLSVGSIECVAQQKHTKSTGNSVGDFSRRLSTDCKNMTHEGRKSPSVCGEPSLPTMEVHLPDCKRLVQVTCLRPQLSTGRATTNVRGLLVMEGGDRETESSTCSHPPAKPGFVAAACWLGGG